MNEMSFISKVKNKAFFDKFQARRAKSTLMNKADIHVLSNGGSSPSLLVSSEGSAYLFNCGEGLQRSCYANRIKLNNIEHLFVTRLHWPKVSGAYGLSLTLQDVGLPRFTIHSTEGISNFFKSTESFMNFSTGLDCKTNVCDATTEFNDSRFRVKSIVLDGNDHETSRKKAKMMTTLLAFHCSLPDLPGSLDPQRCRELNVPVGPKLALLKSGLDVTLDNGTVVKSSDVCGEKTCGPNFIVIDCPSQQDIQSVVQSQELNRLQKFRSQNGERQIDLVIHFSPEEVIKDTRYKQWIDEFPQQCKQIMLVYSEDCAPASFIDSYRLQYLLRQIEPQLFPTLYMPKNLLEMIEASSSTSSPPQENFQDESKNESQNLEDQDRILLASTFDRFVLRPYKTYERNALEMQVDEVYINAKLEPDYEEAYTNYRSAVADLPVPQAHEPEIVFLGTGSALPSKLRNTSCILVNLNLPERATIILDCGEDSYGQIVRHYGPDGAREILENLKMIYVSHHHADHHIGLIEIIRQRKQTRPKNKLQILLPPGIDAHLNYYNDTFEDLSSTYTITNTKDLKIRSITNDTPCSNPLVVDLCRSLDGLLKNISLVGVEHCANACAVVLDINVDHPNMKTFRLAYSGDARPSQDFAKIGDKCDLLIHEATFDHKETIAAIEKKHSTTSEAIEQGKRMRSKFTILTHFSQKYPKIPYFTEEFDETIGFAFDNMAVRCPTDLVRLPLVKDLLKVVFAKSLSEIDARHHKVEYKRKILSMQGD
uniref:ribonuclease Z n=1 Tax=Aceria tosichella TaxID=561515 RepID=A0A6G1SEK5_9ACAR